MKMIIVLTVLACALAEPPIGDGYPLARSSHDKGVEIQRSLSLEYGAPDFSSRSSTKDTLSSFRSGLSSGYAASTRSTPSKQYGEPNLRSGISQEYSAPNSRSLSQEYGVPSSRNAVSQGYESSSRSQGYNSRGLNQNYGVTQLRSDVTDSYNSPKSVPSDSYGSPLQRSPSNLYNAPDSRSNPSEEYGAPAQRNFGASYQPNSRSGFRNSPSNSISQEYGVPAERFGKSQGNSGRNYESFSSRNSPSQTYGAPRSLSAQYGTPNARSSSTYSQGSRTSLSYLPSQGPSESYSAPNARTLSTEYGVPEARANLNTNAYSSSYNIERSSPSASYGVPKSGMPSELYGVPDSYNAISNQGQGYARNALNEILNQEPASYDFGYKVNDYITGSDFGHTETRQDNKAEGSYFVVLPDGTKQIVEYEADERGFKPRISVEPAAARSGYDDNAADLSRSGEGPY